jgi:hypothetical protein
VIIFALLERRERRAIDFDEGTAQCFDIGSVGDPLEAGDSAFSAIASEKEAPLDASHIELLLARKSVDAVAEQLQPDFALHAMRAGNRSESDAALAAVLGRH